ncbi:GntP family permease [Streptococcus hillyeri]|uniref:GntP family permease n=1 Tax=Streptococcus hillyeri TaxID=2282420 RepID=A0A3L9E0B9_9STRE|nr:GntP family permease [Streptococcus hillyeri]RLY04862.1 GntP family permease [Streptococcus hillyeri]
MDSGFISLLGILLALFFLIWGSFKQIPILVLGPVAAVVVIFLSGLPLTETLTGEYAESFAGFAKSNFLIFLPATVLGSMLGDSGAAQDIANKIAEWSMRKGGKNAKFWVLMGLSLITAILSFGGVSGFVVIFTIAPICFRIFKELDIPWHFIIAVSVYGGSMWTAILPGSPAIQNLIPMESLGTKPTAAPVLGIIAAGVSILFGAWYIWWMLKRNENRGEGFEKSGHKMEAASQILAMKAMDKKTTTLDFIKALTPSIVLIVAMNVFDVAPYLSLTLGCLVCFALYFNKFVNFRNTMADGVNSTMKSIMNVAAVVGFGGVVAVAPGFDYLVANLDKIPGPPLIQLAIATNLVAGITGSASGGEAISLNVFAPRFLKQGISADVLHRMVNISCYGLDSLPHNGSVINRLNYTHLTHKEGYYHEFWLGAAFPLVNSIFIAVLASFGIV